MDNICVGVINTRNSIYDYFKKNNLFSNEKYLIHCNDVLYAYEQKKYINVIKNNINYVRKE